MGNDAEFLSSNFNALTNDRERWEWVLENKDDSIIVVDAGKTYVQFCGADYYCEFDSHLGSSSCAFDLLAAMEIGARYE